MLQLSLRLGMNEIDARFIFSGSKSAIEGDAIEPFWKISLGNLTTEHSLEINNEVERYMIQVSGIDKYDVVHQAKEFEKS